ncbi:hypothetical protein SK3146_04828 [Paenibacillus konkukensis]|uniref:Uncharacterized protein n=1 Tax=Paenibacillus konkukensis TaxID=2020716 RepID=A0ABY4RSM4_9BACL|nr:hypothetical protein [Paenibacillus konkukensis]UQZ85539.1 hypothetical protein SK3146_04828 [Paenibacillus konkukensis]
MPIYEAIYRKEDHEEQVTVNNIEQHENYADVKNNLYCTYGGCNARLSYVPKGKVRAHFKTWPKDNHIKDCIDYFERVASASRQKFIATSTMALSDKHIKNVLDNLKRKRNEQETGTNNTKPGTKKRPRPKVDPGSGENPTLNIVPTTGPDADLASGEDNIKEPSVRNRSLINLTDDDLGWTRSLENFIQSVETGDKRAVLELKDGDNSFRVYFEEFFFDDAPVNFPGFFESLKFLVQKGQDCLFSGVGLIERRNGQYAMVVNRSNHFYIDYQYLAVFIHSQSA